MLTRLFRVVPISGPIVRRKLLATGATFSINRGVNPNLVSTHLSCMCMDLPTLFRVRVWA